MILWLLRNTFVLKFTIYKLKIYNHGKFIIYSSCYPDHWLGSWIFCLQCRRYYTYTSCNCANCHTFQAYSRWENRMIFGLGNFETAWASAIK